MNRSLTARIMDLLQRRQFKGVLGKIALALSCMAIFLITYMLVSPVLTQEWETTCGLEEHTHTEDCYEDVLICGLEETEAPGHVHGDDCYEVRMEKVLACGEEEQESGHIHSDECYRVEEVPKYKTVTEEITETVIVEDTETREVTDEDGNVSTEEVVVGTHEETQAVGTREVQVEDGTEEVLTLICGEEEVPGHTHDESCYEMREERVLVCEEEEGEPGHTHEDSCYEHRLTCEMEEHTHTDQCYQKDEENAPQYTCGFLTEHTHGEDCYFENGELKCTIPEHIHDESCLPPEEPERAGGPIFPDEPPEGYVEAEVFDMEGGAMFAMVDDEESGEAGITARVYIPQNAFKEDVVFVPQPLFEEDEAYTAAVEALDQAGAEYDSLTAMDLSFYGTESNEPLEPDTENGPVYVRLAMPAEELPEDAELTLWHHTADGAEMVENYSFECVDGTLTVDFMTDSFSTYTVTTNAAAETGNSPVSWGTTVPSVTPTTDENGVATWDVSSVKDSNGNGYRYVDIPVRINVTGSDAAMTVTLPYALEIADAGRDGYTPKYKDLGDTGENLTVKTDENKNTVTITSTGGGHMSIDVYYKFDCWNIVSGKPFTVEYSVAKGIAVGQGAEQKGSLTGCIKTGNGGTIIPYATEWDESIYSFNGFGGADKKGAYILNWSDVYQKYFGLSQNEFDNNSYIYDIAAFEVQPTGQQPYSINGTITPDQKGEVLGGVYMMDSAGDQEAEGALCLKSIDPGSGFEITENDFTINYDSIKDKVVSALADETDNKTYTLYFLVKYPRASLTEYEEVKDWVGNVIDKKVTLNATLNLTHTGVDSEDKTQIQGETIFCCYDGASSVNIRTYWATYYTTVVNSSAGLTMLKGGNTATVEYSADFFSLNEARADGPRTMVAIIDLAYLTNDGKRQLDVGDYRISGFNLSLIDAPGSWSQNTTNTPNVGWTADKYTTPTSELGNIRVYGSISLTGGTWNLVQEVSATDVWALNQDRAFRGSFTSIDGEYVRLKVEYDSKYTTALRVGYQMELKPGIVDKYSLSDVETLNLTNWLNYGAYKNNTISADNADTDYFVFQRYPVDDSDPAWTIYDGTIQNVREYDNAYGPTSGLPGYNIKSESWGEGYSLRNFAETTLNSSNDVAGMMVTQALYDSTGKLVGSPTSIDPNTNDSYSLKTDVDNVSEIVYNISGAVTSGASSLGDLQEHINAAGDDSPYKSLKMRYYVLLPDGLKLNTNPDNGETDENGAPKYHFWTEGTTEYLSANSAFYNNDSSKVVQGGQTDVPVSGANIPGWNRYSANGNLSEMYWVAGGSVIHDTAASNGQLVVFERTLGNWVDYDRFNMWGAPETYFWGRGLSFSVVPTYGTGTLPAGSYTPQFWCQFLDGDGDPISLGNFAKNVDDVHAELVQQDADTLLYIPSTFTNKQGLGYSTGKIEVNIDDKDSIILEDGRKAVKPEGSYTYPLTYNVTTGSSTDVVLWCNVEDIQYYSDMVQSEWKGTVTGVNLKDTDAKVYVKNDTFKVIDYKDKDNQPGTGANKDWLTSDNGWILVDDPDKYESWSTVEAIAFYFENKMFNQGDSATVYLNMKAPKDNGLTIGDNISKDPNKTVYTAYNELLYSDTHKDSNGSDVRKGCEIAPFVSVPMKVTPVSYVLPSTGGAGTTTLYTTGVAFLTASAYLMYQSLRRSRVTGVPAAEPEDKRGGSRVR